jgi:hypothetical protein
VCIAVCHATFAARRVNLAYDLGRCCLPLAPGRDGESINRTLASRPFLGNECIGDARPDGSFAEPGGRALCDPFPIPKLWRKPCASSYDSARSTFRTARRWKLSPPSTAWTVGISLQRRHRMSPRSAPSLRLRASLHGGAGSRSARRRECSRCRWRGRNRELRARTQ